MFQIPRRRCACGHSEPRCAALYSTLDITAKDQTEVLLCFWKYFLRSAKCWNAGFGGKIRFCWCQELFQHQLRSYNIRVTSIRPPSRYGRDIETITSRYLDPLRKSPRKHLSGTDRNVVIGIVPFSADILILIINFKFLQQATCEKKGGVLHMLWISLYYSIEPITAGTKFCEYLLAPCSFFHPTWIQAIRLFSKTDPKTLRSPEPRNLSGGGKGAYRLPCCRHKCPNIFYCRL